MILRLPAKFWWLSFSVLWACNPATADTAAAVFGPPNAAAKIERIPYAAELLPAKRPINFWAYQQGLTQYIPATSLGKLLNAKIHRYDKSAMMTLHLGRQRSIQISLNQKSILLGSQELKLTHPVIRSPDLKDLLIPIEALENQPLRDYAQFDFEILDDNKLIACPIEKLDPPAVTNNKDHWLVSIRLTQKGPAYSITFHPSNSKTKTPAKLILRFPYAQLETNAKTPLTKTLTNQGLSWSASTDTQEQALLLAFSLAGGITFDQISATEDTWPARRLSIKITKNQIPPPPLAAASNAKTPTPKTPLVAPKTSKSPIANTKAPTPPSISAPVQKTAPSIKSDQRFVIMLDAGHGGKDSGSINRAGIKEKDINLQLTLKISQALGKTLPQAHIILSRRHDTTVSLSDRVAQARQKNAQLFVSVHANAARTKNRGGFEVYIPSVITLDPSTAELIHREYAQEKIKKSKKISPEARLIRQSEKIAQLISLELDENIAERISNRGILRGDFLVLRESNIPSILIETGFITHANDVRYLINPKFQEIYAQGIARGITQYVKEIQKEALK